MTQLIGFLNNSLYTLLSFAFALGVIIIVHEAGHLLVAKAFGVRVLTFSVGFGRRLWGFRRGETDYRVSIVPLGGYVRLGGENPDEVTNDPREFLNKPRWQRILVYLAGPAMNVVLAVALVAALFMVGIQMVNLPDTPPLIGEVEKGSSAARAGLRRGDLILRVKGEPVDDWQDVALALMGSPERPLPLAVRRDGRIVQTAVTPGRVPKYDLGDSAGLVPSVRAQIIQVLAGQPAAAGGFLPGDEVRAVDGRPISDKEDFIKVISGRKGQRVEVRIVRQGKPLTLVVVPDPAGRIGVYVGSYQFRRFGPGRAVVESVRYNVQMVRDTFMILGKMLHPRAAGQRNVRRPDRDRQAERCGGAARLQRAAAPDGLHQHQHRHHEHDADSHPGRRTDLRPVDRRGDPARPVAASEGDHQPGGLRHDPAADFHGDMVRHLEEPTVDLVLRLLSWSRRGFVPCQGGANDARTDLDRRPSP